MRPGRIRLWASEPSNSDAVRFNIPNSYATPRVCCPHRPVNWPRHDLVAQQLGVGVRVCLEGQVSDSRCGDVSATDQTVTMYVDICDRYQEVRHMWFMDYLVQRGDSGGPVYRVPKGNAACPSLVNGRRCLRPDHRRKATGGAASRSRRMTALPLMTDLLLAGGTP